MERIKLIVLSRQFYIATNYKNINLEAFKNSCELVEMNKQPLRPVSPHITIYKLQMSSALSIAHRVSGCLLFIGLITVLWWLVYCVLSCGRAAPGVLCMADFVLDIKEDYLFNFFGTKIGLVLLSLWSYCLFYHAAAGIRHLFWDFGIGFKIKQMLASGRAIILVSFLGWLLTWSYLLLMR